MSQPQPGPWARATSAADLGAFLRMMRERAGLSQQQVADELGLDRRYIYQIESGAPSLYLARLFALMRSVDVRMELHGPAGRPEDDEP